MPERSWLRVCVCLGAAAARPHIPDHTEYPNKARSCHLDLIGAPVYRNVPLYFRTKLRIVLRTILTANHSCQENSVSNEQTRRTFLKLSAVGLTATAAADWRPRFTASAAAPAGEIAVRVTSGKLRYAAARQSDLANRRKRARTRSCSIPARSSRRCSASALPSPTPPATRSISFRAGPRRIVS